MAEAVFEALFRAGNVFEVGGGSGGGGRNGAVGHDYATGDGRGFGFDWLLGELEIDRDEENDGDLKSTLITTPINCPISSHLFIIFYFIQI